VRTLVDEFSALARFPASRPQPSNLNNLVESALLLFDGRLQGVRLGTALAPDLPQVMADPEAIKRAIAKVMERQNFTVKVKGDQVDARLLKYPRPVIEEKLEMIGRLLLFTRQMDMLMDSEYSVEAVVQNFLAGNYRYDQALIDQLRQG